MTADELPLISIGVVLGDNDTESRAWETAIRDFRKEVIARRVRLVPDALKVNVIFHVDGRLMPNEFEGVRTGRLSRKEGALVVQAALPAFGEGKHALIRSTFLEAVQLADTFVREKRLSDGLPNIVAFAKELVDERRYL